MSKKINMDNMDNMQHLLTRMAVAPTTILFPKFDYDEVIGYTKSGWSIERTHYKYELGTIECGQPSRVHPGGVATPAEMAYLLQGGYIRSVLLFPNGDQGRPEVYYRITAKGQKLYRDEIENNYGEDFALANA